MANIFIPAMEKLNKYLTAEISIFYSCSVVFSVVRMHSLWLNVAIRFGLMGIFEFVCTKKYIQKLNLFFVCSSFCSCHSFSRSFAFGVFLCHELYASIELILCVHFLYANVFMHRRCILFLVLTTLWTTF